MLGLFDSGIGGLTVVRELLRRTPDASFVYLGDTARAPYGNKSPELICRYAVEDVAFLLSQGATDIVVACNTASALAMETLRETYPHVRFFDVITPAVESTLRLEPKTVGVIGTRATIGSGVYEKKLYDAVGAPLAGALPVAERRAGARPAPTVISVACPLFVPLVEEGWTKKAETKRIVRAYLAPLRQKQIDALILGCTHYPLLLEAIRSALQKRVKIIDSPSALLDQMEKSAPELLLQTAPTPSNSPFERGRTNQKFFFSDVSSVTDQLASRWLSKPVKGMRALFPSG